MQLVCLGTTGYHPSPTRHTACYYLPELELLLDAGTGLHRLTQHLIAEPKQRLDIVLSHAHLDHVIGLTFLLDVMAVTSLKSVRLFGQPAKLNAVRDHLFHEQLFPVPLNLELVELPESTGEIQLPHCRLEYFPLEHPGGSIGMIVRTSSRRMAYITDTIPQTDQRFRDKVRDVDLMLHECYFQDSHRELSLRTGHSWIGAVDELVSIAKPAKTLLIHMNPLAEVIGGEIELTEKQVQAGMQVAHDGLVVEF